MTLLLALPVVLPMLAGALCMLAWRHLRFQRVFALAGCLGQLAAALLILQRSLDGQVQLLATSAWPAPFGIVLVADGLSAVLVLMTALTGLASAVYALPTVARADEQAGFFPLMQLVLAAVAGAFLTGDLFNLYVWFEVMLMASFALLAMGGERAQMAGALQYVVLNLVSSALFLTAVGLLYGLAGTLNLADLSVKLAQVQQPGRVTVIATLLMLGFGIKAAAFPLYFWLPASYHTPPVAVSALFAGLLTKVGVYALYRCFTLVFTQDVAYTHGVLAWVAGATMLAGALGALAQSELRRSLAYLHVGQVGYLLMGLALFTPQALAGGVFYIVHHIVAMANLFLLAGLITRIGGSQQLAQLGGLWKTHPGLGLLFLVPALSLGGIPPLSGFWAKLLLLRAALEQGAGALMAVALLAGLLTLIAVLRIWSDVFWKPAPNPLQSQPQPQPFALWAVTTTLAGLTLLIGLAGQPLLALAEQSAAQLITGTAYRAAVLPATAP